MRSRSTLYTSIDPFVSRKKLLEWIMPAGQICWLRYLSLIQDLETLNKWRTDPAVRSNMDKTQDAAYAIKQYRSYLNSHTAQVFMAGCNALSVCIFKLTLLQASSFSLIFPGTPEDSLLEFMFHSLPDATLTLAPMLLRFADYYFSFQPGSALHIILPASDFLNIQAVEDAGFTEIRRPLKEGDGIRVFSMGGIRLNLKYSL